MFLSSSAQLASLSGLMSRAFSSLSDWVVAEELTIGVASPWNLTV